MFLAGLPLTLLLPSRARHRNRLMSGGSRPRPYYTEVRPGVLRHFCGEHPSQVMDTRFIKLSCVSSFAAMVASTKSTDGARRPCADYWALNSPAVRHAYLLPLKVDVETLNRLHGADALFSIGLRGGCKQASVCSGLGGDGQVCGGPRPFPVVHVQSLLTFGLHWRLSSLRCTMLCAAGRVSARASTSATSLCECSTTAARRKHLWIVLDWLLELRLHVCARMFDFWLLHCHCECIWNQHHGRRSLPPVAPDSPRTTRCMHRRR